MPATDRSTQDQISGFLAKYTPEIVAFATVARKRMRKEVPGGFEFVYDNYSALVFGRCSRLRHRRDKCRDTLISR